MPSRVRDVVLRGLAFESTERWPSMDALLAALTRDPARVRRRWMVAGSAVAALCALALSYRAMLHRESLVCRGAERKLAGVWDEGRKRAVHSAFLATGVPYAEATYGAVARTLDAFATGWVAMHTEACEATRIRREQSDDLLDLRMECLGQELREAKAQVDLLAEADAKVMPKAASMVSSLPQLSDCQNVAALRDPVRPPRDPALRAHFDELSTQVAQLKAMQVARKDKEGLALGARVAAEAHALKLKSVEGKALHVLGWLQNETGDSKTAEKTLTEATLVARASRDNVTEVYAWGSLLAVASNQGRFDQGRLWARSGVAALEAMAGKSPVTEARFLQQMGRTTMAEGKYEEALDYQRRALAIREAEESPLSPNVASALENVAAALNGLGRYAEAEPYVKRALAIHEKRQLTEHPDYGSSLFNLAYTLAGQGRYEEALVSYRRNLAIWERTLGTENPRLSSTINNIGFVLALQHKFSEALPYYQRALVLTEKTRGPEHLDVGLALCNIADCLAEAGRYDEATAAGRRAIGIFDKVYKGPHPYIATTLNTLGHVELNRHQPQAAVVTLGRSLAMWEKIGSSDLAPTAAVRFLLARALWESGRDRARALSLATQAHAEYVKVGAKSKTELAEVDTWLAAHRAD